MAIRLVPDQPSYAWGDEVRLRYEADSPDELQAVVSLSGLGSLVGTTIPVTGSLKFHATYEEPVLAGYDFTQDATDPALWVGNLA